MPPPRKHRHLAGCLGPGGDQGAASTVVEVLRLGAVQGICSLSDVAMCHSEKGQFKDLSPPRCQRPPWHQKLETALVPNG